MNQNKIIIYSLIGLIAIGLGWIVYFIVSAPKNTEPTTNIVTPTEIENSEFYFISLTELSGNIYSKAIVGDKTIDLDLSNIAEYISVGFTSDNERIGIICAKGRFAKNAVSSTNNQVNIELGSTSVGMNLNKDTQNTISFICSKTPQD